MINKGSAIKFCCTSNAAIKNIKIACTQSTFFVFSLSINKKILKETKILLKTYIFGFSVLSPSVLTTYLSNSRLGYRFTKTDKIHAIFNSYGQILTLNLANFFGGYTFLEKHIH